MKATFKKSPTETVDQCIDRFLQTEGDPIDIEDGEDDLQLES